MGHRGAIQKESNAQQKDSLHLEASHNSQRGQTFMAACGTPLPEGPNMDTNSNLSQHLILALTSDAGDLDSASAEWVCRALTP